MTQYLLKNSLGKAAIARQSRVLAAHAPNFNSTNFQRAAQNGLDALSLKERVQHIIRCMNQVLPQDFTKAAPILAACGKNWPEPSKDEKYPSFAAWPFIDYVAHYGLQHPDIALPLLAELTELFSAEFAIQPFVIHHFALTHQTMLQWCEHENEHVRRLASEGMRSRLPWGLRIQSFCDDPSPILPILHKLKNDKSLYVRKSVANNINDISKDNPDIAIALCKLWLDEGASAETLWIIKHGSRGLVKAGNPAMLALLGYQANDCIRCSELDLSDSSIRIGEEIGFNALLSNHTDTDQAVIIDYAVIYPRPQGKALRKVFKISQSVIKANSESHVEKMISFKAISTRRYYAGIHHIELLINGQVLAQASFQLLP